MREQDLLAEIDRLEAHIERLWKKWEELIDAKWEIERLRAILKTAANNFDSLGAHHYASWCRLSLKEGSHLQEAQGNA